jgi:hypothetical protein
MVAPRPRGTTTGGDKRIDPVDAMLEVVKGFETFVDRSRVREGRSTRYRANLLWVHALAAMTMAPLFAASRAGMNTPNFTFLLMLPGAPLSVALMLGTGGLILGMGCVLDARRLEIAGLIALATFYLTLSMSFAIAAIAFYLSDSPGPRPAIYSPILYLHMTIIMAVHMSTLVRNRWGQRGGL